MSDTTRDHKSRLVSWNSCRDATVNTMVGTQQAEGNGRPLKAIPYGGEEEEESKNVYVYRIPFAPTMRLYMHILVYSFFGNGTCVINVAGLIPYSRKSCRENKILLVRKIHLLYRIEFKTINGMGFYK